MAKKRASNEGTIYQRSDGRWESKLRLGRGRQSFYGKTQKEVLDKLATAKRALQDGTPVSPAKQTLDKFLANWLRDTVRPMRRPKTVRSYEQMIRNHIVPVLGHMKLKDLSPQMVQNLINRKLKEGLSPRTVQYAHGILRSALSQAEKWGIVPRNVAKLVTAPKPAHHDFKVLTPEQAQAFLRSAAGDRLSALFTVALGIGLRMGECLGLKWEDVDLETGTVTVRRQLQRVGTNVAFTEPKSAKGRRVIDAPSFVTDSLTDHRLSQELQDKALAGSDWPDTGLVFTSLAGKPLDERYVRRSFKAVLARAGLEPMRFHDLRHSCASLLLAKNVQPRAIMEILGHSQIGLTMNTYAHVMPSLKRAAADAMDEHFRKAK